MVALIHKLSELWEGQRPYLVHLYCMLFSTAYFGLFRVGELTLSPHAIKAINVQMGLNKRKILFVLDSSKMHGPDALPQRVKISSTLLKLRCKDMSTKHPQYCPYTHLREYIWVRPKSSSAEEQFFVFSDSSPVKPQHMRATMKVALKSLGYDHSLFSTHSFCIGRGCDLLKCGLSVESIKQLGRWKSNAVFTYLKQL